MTPDEISISKYIDTRIKSVEDKLDGQMQFFSQHFVLTALALEKAEKETEARKVRRDADFKDMEGRISNLEMTRSFSEGKMWMVMALFATVPTILAILALIKRS